ncbi:MAG TPA: ATP-binding protein, partial [Firmicutes bacterium]|nr:ATP-binding protein [Bacillota bacterium]
IDIEEHAQWCRGRCEAAGLEGVFPLWQRDRKENAREILALGYQCVMKCVRNDALPQEMLGKVLDDSLLRQMESLGIDVCGENGEYHTIVLGGPIFHTPVPYTCGEILDFGNISAMDIRLAKE